MPNKQNDAGDRNSPNGLRLWLRHWRKYADRRREPRRGNIPTPARKIKVKLDQCGVRLFAYRLQKRPSSPGIEINNPTEDQAAMVMMEAR
mmetsp:Transcript_2235/g.5235  ORF Transcript_2235/g.5235 Transcript_2235/m.5235 type:complete len:90 (+) Transcript_2235:397-666(+)